MGGEPGGVQGAKPHGLDQGVQGGSRGAEPLVYKCTAYKRGPGSSAPSLQVHSVQGGSGGLPLVWYVRLEG